MSRSELDGIVEIENVWIPMADGCRIAARIWLPKDAEAAPVPAILEYIPYRKRDFMRARDEPIHRYFARSGYAAVRVDLRGSGDSDGILLDEYTRQEQDDALEIIAWIAAQPWCAGAVGMMGISWGGFNALQVAALDPPALKAIITLCSTDDRYADDAHYMGGCLLNENLQWGSILLGARRLSARSADRRRALARDVARADRAAGAVPGALAAAPVARRLLAPRLGLRGLRRDQMRGLRDRRLGGRLLQRRAAPARRASRARRRGWSGPGRTSSPTTACPGPRSAFSRRRCAGGTTGSRALETGIMDEPLYRVWMQDSVDPKPYYEERPGRWVAEAAWPSPRIEQPAPVPQPRPARPGAEPAGEARVLLAPDHRAHRRRMVRVRRRGRDAARAAPRRRPLADLRDRSRSPSGSRSWARRWSSSTSPPTSRSALLAVAPQRRPARRHLDARHLRPAQPHPSRRPRAARAARARHLLPHPAAAQRHRARLPGRPPAAASRCPRATGRSPGRRPTPRC